MIAAHVTSLLEEVPIPFDAFLRRMEKTDVTGWRWRKQGWIKTTNLAGRLYVMPADLREFNRRLASGEFAKEHKAPKQNRLASEDTSLSE